MVEITSFVIADASPERVWSVLTDFGRYSEWHPYQTIDGKAEKFSSLRIVTRSLADRDSIEDARGVIITFQPCRRLAFFTGRPLLYSTRRFFELAPHGGGSLLKHGIRVGGVFGKRAFAAPQSKHGLQLYLQAFETALVRRVTTGTSGNSGSPNRRSRRRAKAGKT